MENKPNTVKTAEEFIRDKRNERFPTHLSLSQTTCTHTDAVMWAHEYAQSQTEELREEKRAWRAESIAAHKVIERLKSENEAIAKHNADLLKTIEKGEREIERLKEIVDRQEKLMKRAVVIRQDVKDFPLELQEFASENNRQWLELQNLKVAPVESKETPDNTCLDCWGSGWETQFITPCKTCKGTGKINPPQNNH